MLTRHTALYCIEGAYKLSEDFAKSYFHKYWTEIHDVYTTWKRNVCGFIVTLTLILLMWRIGWAPNNASKWQMGFNSAFKGLNAFDVRLTCDTADVQTILPIPPNPLKHVLCDVPDCGRTSNVFKVTMKLQTFLFQMVVTSCISVQYLRKYGFAKSSDNLYAPCITTCNGSLIILSS